MTKAGSTAIQNYLDQCRSELKTHGVLVPKTGFTRGNPFDPERTSGHLELVRSMRRGDARSLEAELSETGAQVVVLSAENIFLDRSDDELRAVARHFRGWEIVVIVVVRSQAAWLQSRYVESVVSGYQMSALTGKEFCAVAVEKGWLDYLGALERAGELLSADKVLLLNYESAAAGNHLVEDFLRIAELPRTDGRLAESIRSNERKKDFGLVEVKRRLNYLLRDWPKDARLEFEAAFRKLPDAAEVSGIAQPQLVQPFQYLSEAQREAVLASNRELLRKFGLACPLEEVTNGVVSGGAEQHRYTGGRLDKLTLAGWKLAAEIGRNQELQATGAERHRKTVLSVESIDRILDLIVSAQVSLHVGMTEFALIAASFARKLPIFLPTEENDGEELIDVLLSRLPSEIICLEPAARQGAVTTVNIILERRAPDIVFARAASSVEHLSALLSRSGCACTIVLLEAVTANLAVFVEKFALDIAHLDNDCVILCPQSDSRRRGAA